ncbi:MAG TPA: hypothetical protein VK830_00650 [Xanthomonadales bacterium]|nr:hypothetical protein [Xanthomonadales bacterium]
MACIDGLGSGLVSAAVTWGGGWSQPANTKLAHNALNNEIR